MNMKDNQIINRIIEGDPRGMEAVYEMANKMIKKMVLNNSGTETEAEDIVQETVIVFWKKVTEDNLILSCKISSYLYSVAWNLWRKRLNYKKKFISDKDYDVIDESLSIERAIEVEEQREIVQDTISELSEACQLLMNKSLNGETTRDMADQLGYKNSESAKTQLCKCRSQLSKAIRKKYDSTDFNN